MNLLLLDESDFPDREDHVVLYGRRLHHIRTVFRAVEGCRLRVGLVNGKTGTGQITFINDTRAELQVDCTDDPPAPLPLVLICALPRPKSFKKVVESATSLGVKKLCFIGSWRVEKSYWQSPVLVADSIDEHIRAGLEQARDTVFPEILFKRRFRPFAEDDLPGLIGSSMAFVAHPYNASPCPYGCLKNNSVTLIIGPEGGFIPFEIELLTKNGVVSVTVGERILRVETAVAACIGRMM